jgi:2-polyprenyl-3-methyl-5-hydroxy-6-metoxy-1,4-benzoquinol methylase
MQKVLNSWEGRGESFLSKAFNKDSDDIATHLEMREIVDICELGFGNNRLLKTLLDKDIRIDRYRGLDKTQTFVRRARERYPEKKLSFSQFDITQSDKLFKLLTYDKPEIVIVRHVLEHVPEYREILSTLNKTEVEYLAISLFITSSGKPESTLLEDADSVYTINKIPLIEIAKLLTEYSISRIFSYDPFPHKLMIFKRTFVD